MEGADCGRATARPQLGQKSASGETGAPQAPQRSPPVAVAPPA